MSDRWSVYIVECADSTLYTGVARSVRARLIAHNRGKGARYTRGRLPVRLLYQEDDMSKGEAQRRESAIKRLQRKEKLRLIDEGPPTRHWLALAGPKEKAGRRRPV